MTVSIIHQNRSKSLLKQDNLKSETEIENSSSSEEAKQEKLTNEAAISIHNQRTLLRFQLKSNNEIFGKIVHEMKTNLKRLNLTTNLLYLVFFNLPTLIFIQMIITQISQHYVNNPDRPIIISNIIICIALLFNLMEIFEREPIKPEESKKKLMAPKFYDYLSRKFCQQKIKKHYDFEEAVKNSRSELEQNYQDYLTISFNKELFDIKGIAHSYKYMKKLEKINSTKEHYEKEYPFYYDENLHHIINKHLYSEAK